MGENKDYQIRLSVNNSFISLNPFVQQVIKNVIISLVSSLKVESQPERIEITIEKTDVD